MSYLGLVPSERSTGEARRQGAITKSGSSLARWLLIEAAWHYRHSPRLGAKLARRQHGQEAAVIALSWKTQQRLYQLWRRLDHKRGKRRQLVAVAIARHLAGFCWAIVNLDAAPNDTRPANDADLTPSPSDPHNHSRAGLTTPTHLHTTPRPRCSICSTTLG